MFRFRTGDVLAAGGITGETQRVYGGSFKRRDRSPAKREGALADAVSAPRTRTGSGRDSVVPHHVCGGVSGWLGVGMSYAIVEFSVAIAIASMMGLIAMLCLAAGVLVWKLIKGDK